MNVQALEFEKPILELEAELEKMREKSASQNIDLGSEISAAEEKLEAMRKQIYQELTPWYRSHGTPSVRSCWITCTMCLRISANCMETAWSVMIMPCRVDWPGLADTVVW